VTEYEERVRELELQGCTTSDAQAIADWETGEVDTFLLLKVGPEKEGASE
jgi:hypothetical protein